MKKKLTVSHKDLFSHMANGIAEHGQTIISVFGSKKHPGFCYTIGNQEKQLPELLLIGNFKPDQTSAILAHLSAMMRERKSAFKDGETIDLGGKHPLLIHNALPAAKNEYTIQAGQFYQNEDYSVQQVLLPDPNGRYPGGALCHKDYKVPVLWEVKQ